MQTIPSQTAAPREHYAPRLKRELAESREETARLRERIRELNEGPEIPVYATHYEGAQGCLNYRDKGNEKRRSLSGCMDRTEVLYRANGAPVFDVTAVPFADLFRIGDLPIAERVAAFDAIHTPRVLRN